VDTVLSAVPRQTLINLVGGLVDEDALREVGIEIEAVPGGTRINSPPVDAGVEPSVVDVASGFVAAWAQSPETLQTWSRLMLGVLEIDLVALENDPEGDELLGAIWDAAEGSFSGIEVATRLASR